MTQLEPALLLVESSSKRDLSRKGQERESSQPSFSAAASRILTAFLATLPLAAAAAAVAGGFGVWIRLLSEARESEWVQKGKSFKGGVKQKKGFTLEESEFM